MTGWPGVPDHLGDGTKFPCEVGIGGADLKIAREKLMVETTMGLD
jgi:hypothetical protein